MQVLNIYKQIISIELIFNGNSISLLQFLFVFSLEELNVLGQGYFSQFLFLQ